MHLTVLRIPPRISGKIILIRVGMLSLASRVSGEDAFLLDSFSLEDSLVDSF